MHACKFLGTLLAMSNWARFVLSLTAGENQKAVSARTGVDQSTISRWLRGEKSPDSPGLVAHFAQCYGANVLEAFVAAGFLTEEEAGMPPQPKLDFYALVDADADLSEESKEHIKNQYGLLKAASAHTRTLSLREEILNNANLDDQTRRQLLATLEGGAVEDGQAEDGVEPSRTTRRRRSAG